MSTEATTEIERDVEPADVGELVQRRRLKEIFSARENFTETRREITNRQLSGQVPQSKIEHALRTCIEEYTMYIEPMFASADDPDYWREEIELGEIEVPESVRDSPIAVNGFAAILDTSWPMVFEYDVPEEDELYGETQKTKSVKVDLPEEISHAAFRKLNEFLRDHGVKYRMEDGLPTDQL
ncbi:hypothetical protein SAMN06269185_3345 [Natronoarchaeum philippinense]|uniref:Uncharacterized protein n=1 Tax=Natronoarchaeum philippinense TaxID=558529 RepID=A0A285P9E0_NATPI|nr:hypothetical protein [Natronoarchaeum philippinense]SNZ18360.1 hypothetical protein SAMN06269185_3345 [Natronoarchaeum philippinense]